MYNIVGLYISSLDTTYKLKQTVVNNAPSTLHNLIDSSGNVVLDDTETPLLVEWTGGAFPTAKPATILPNTRYLITGIFSIVQSTFRIYTLMDGVYRLMTLDYKAVPDPGTNETSNVTINWNGTDAFPLTRPSASGYSYIRYYITDFYDPYWNLIDACMFV